MSTHQEAFDEGVEAAGGLTLLASALGETPQAVGNWRARGVPANKCKRFEAITGVSVKRLRPADWQDYWPECPPATLPAAQGAACIQ